MFGVKIYFSIKNVIHMFTEIALNHFKTHY